MAQLPQSVAYEQLKQNLINLVNAGVNDYHLPPFTIAALLKDIYIETQNQVQLEYQRDLQQYQLLIEQEQKAKEQK